MEADGKGCSHLAKLGFTEPVRCGECAFAPGEEECTGTANGDDKSLWVCLECGYYACGADAYPTRWDNISTPVETHVFRHIKSTKHSTVMNYEYPHICYCFTCGSLVPVQKSEADGKGGGTLFDMFKLLSVKDHGKNVAVKTAATNIRMSVKDFDVKDENNNDKGSNHGVRGLVNLGNTCYLNSIVQNLLAMDKLREYFLKLGDDVSITPFSLTSSLKELFKETSLETKSSHAMNSESIFKSVHSMFPMFEKGVENDSHELLRCLLAGLCEELQANKLPSVVHIFNGQLSSTITCVCGEVETKYEPSLDLSLPIPQKSQCHKVSIESCLTLYTELEPVSWLCNNCEKELQPKKSLNSSSTKKIFIDKLPSIMCIHLKRFIGDVNGSFNKLEDHVDFQTTLDIRPYMVTRDDEARFDYRLIGLVEHVGKSMVSGHYIAYIRKGNKGEDGTWYCVSDEKVRQVSVEQVLGCKGAYILFYQLF